MFASFESNLLLVLARGAFHSQDDLLCGLSLLLEDRLGLTTETGLLTIVSSLTLGEKRSLTSLVLGDLVQGVLLARLALAVALLGLGDRKSVV